MRPRTRGRTTRETLARESRRFSTRRRARRHEGRTHGTCRDAPRGRMTSEFGRRDLDADPGASIGRVRAWTHGRVVATRSRAARLARWTRSTRACSSASCSRKSRSSCRARVSRARTRRDGRSISPAPDFHTSSVETCVSSCRRRSVRDARARPRAMGRRREKALSAAGNPATDIDRSTDRPARALFSSRSARR